MKKETTAALQAQNNAIDTQNTVIAAQHRTISVIKQSQQDVITTHTGMVTSLTTFIEVADQLIGRVPDTNKQMIETIDHQLKLIFEGAKEFDGLKQQVSTQ